MKSATLKFNCRRFKHRSSLPSLSAEEARQKVNQLLADHLQLKIDGYACDTQTICDVLVKASGRRQGHRRHVQQPGHRPDRAYCAVVSQRPTAAR